jgi:rare lipoprotein A
MKKPILLSILIFVGVVQGTAQELAGHDITGTSEELAITPANSPIPPQDKEPGSSKQKTSQVPAKRIKKTAKIQYGMASFYHNKFHGRKTSSGELYDREKMTAAHNGLPLNTWIRVTNIRNGRTVIVKVNDRLHHRNERLVDLSRTAASRLGYIGRGLTRVKVEVLGKMKPAEIAKKDH